MSAADGGAAFCDDRTWCEECLRAVEGGCCPLHPLLPISDRPVLSRARQTLPAMFKLRAVGCNRAALVTEYGVFAKRLVQKQSSFGPAEGRLVDDPTAGAAHCGLYHFRVFSSTDKAYKFLDNTNEETCNWMMFVRPAANGNEQNLVAYQHRGGIYMTAIKVIRPGEELKFWYAKEYASLIGKDLLSVNTFGASELDEVSQLLLSLPTATDVEPAVTESTPGSGVAQQCYHTQQHIQLTMTSGEPLSPTCLSLEAKVGLRSLRCKSSVAAADIAAVAERHQGQRPVGTSSRPDDRIQAIVCGRRVAASHAAHSGVTAASDAGLPSCESDGAVDGSNNSIRRPVDDPSFEGAAATGGCSGTRSTGASGGGCCSPDGGRRTRNKRKGRPKKVTTVGGDRKRRKSSTAAAAVARAAEAAAAASAMITCPTTDATALAAGTAQQQQQTCLATEEPQQPPRRQRPRRSQQQRGARQQSLPLKCTECGLEFATRGKLQVHGYVHTGERPFRCGQPGCGKGFSSRFKLVRHELIHQPQKRHRCRVCDKPFSRRDHLNNHLAALHDGNRRAHVCEYCRKSYATLHAYRAHVAYHRALAGELACAVCLRQFDGREALVAHIKAHAGSRSLKGAAEKRFSCGQCDKRFLTQKDVRRHQVTHTKEKRFSCRLCGQCFGRQDHLTRHLKKNHCTVTSAAGAAATMLSAAAAAAAVRDGLKLAAAPTCDISSPGLMPAAAATSSAADAAGSRATSRLGASAESIAARQLVTAVHAGSSCSTAMQLQQNETPTAGAVAAAAGFAEVSDVVEPTAIGGIGVDGGQTLASDYLTLSVFPGAVSPGGQHQQYFLFNGYGAATAGGLLKHVPSSVVAASAADHLPVTWQPIIVSAGPPPAAVVAVAAADSASDGRYCSSAAAAATAVASSSSTTALASSSSVVPCRGRGSATALLDCGGDGGGSHAPTVGAPKGECPMLHSLMPAAAIASMPDEAILGVVVQRDALDHGTLATAASLSSPENSCIVSGIGGCRSDELSACAYMEAMKALSGFDACISSAAAIAASNSLGGSPPSVEQIAHAHDGLG